MRPPEKIEAQYFDLAGASAYVGGGISIRTLRKLVASDLPSIRVGWKILVSRSDLDRYLLSRRREPVDLDGMLADLCGKKPPGASRGSKW